eukprot:352248-Alexandrium_andersonii.AAC.1
MARLLPMRWWVSALLSARTALLWELQSWDLSTPALPAGVSRIALRLYRTVGMVAARAWGSTSFWGMYVLGLELSIMS